MPWSAVHISGSIFNLPRRWHRLQQYRHPTQRKYSSCHRQRYIRQSYSQFLDLSLQCFLRVEHRRNIRSLFFVHERDCPDRKELSGLGYDFNGCVQLYYT